MAPTGAGLLPAKQAKHASLSPAQPYPSVPVYSPSSPSTASFSPSSPRSPAYSTILTYQNSLSKTGCTPRQHRSMKRNRGTLSSPASLSSSRVALGLSSCWYCPSPDLRSVSRGTCDRSAALRPRSQADDCGDPMLPARCGRNISYSPESAKSSVYSSCEYVDCEGRADSGTCSDPRGARGNRTSEKKLQFSQNLSFLEEVRCRDAVFDVCFHTTRPGLLAAGLVNGGIELHQLPTAEEITAYLEICCRRRREERVTVRRARRVKCKMQQRTSIGPKVNDEQRSSSIVAVTPLLEASWCSSDDVRTSEERRSTVSSKETRPAGIFNGAYERGKRQSPGQRQPHRWCAAATDADDSAATTAGDRRDGMSYLRTRSPSRDTTGSANDVTSGAHARTGLKHIRSPSCEPREVNEIAHSQASSSEDSCCTSEYSSSDEDEVLDESACRKELQDFETRVAALHYHKRGCRAVRFSHDGHHVYKKQLLRFALTKSPVDSFLPRAIGDLSFQTLKRKARVLAGAANDKVVKTCGCMRRRAAYSEAINALCVLTDDVIAAGDDKGCITLWDTRQTPMAEPIVRLQDHEDFISDLAAATNGDEQPRRSSSRSSNFTSTSSQGNHGLPTHIVATGGDMLGVFDLRRRALLARSDSLGEDLHCVQIVKNGSKVVCGCQDGSLGIFSWGDFGDINDRLTGHKQSVDAMAKLEEDIVITGSSDGLIRIVQVLPNAILGILGQHKDGLATVEKLALSFDKSLLASCSYDETISISQVAAAQRLIDGRRKRGKLPKKAGRQSVADLRRDRDFFDDL